MRILGEINDYGDLYQPVLEADIEAVEAQLELAFPESYRRFVKNPDIEVIKKLPSLLWFVRHSYMGILDANALLRGSDFEPYPDHLIAFATNECGDFYCFDRDTGRIVYIDPDYSIEENLGSNELVFDSFEQWLENKGG